MNNNLRDFLKEFFPDYFKYAGNILEDDRVTLLFETMNNQNKCPICGSESSKYVTYYTRTIQDLPILDKTTYVKVRFKKMICPSENCSVSYFNETLDEYVAPKRRYSNRLNDLMIKIALTNTAEGGSRLCRERHIIISGDKLLQLAKEYEPKIEKGGITSIGVDDFALKKTIDTELFS